MNTKTEQSDDLDTVKLGVACLLVVAALLGFYYYDELSMLFRVVGLILVIGVAATIAWATAKGRETVGFLKEAQIEVKKVVWPTRQETVQTTFFVLIVVVIFAILLWLLDLLLSSAVKTLI